jgi:hypothetical protein
MADPSQSEDFVQPLPSPEESTLSVDDPTTELLRLGRYYDDRVQSSVNAQPSPKLQGPAALPVLAEVTVTGYRKGTPLQVLCCRVSGFLVEKSTAYDFLLMRRAAKADGIRLAIVTAFRDMETQTRLYLERSDPRVKAVKGPAAKPGHSNHQSGIAIDILVNMTVADKAEGRFSKEYLWLKAHAPQYGFDNDEVSTEPWHWRHLPTSIVGTSPALATLDAVTNTDSSTSAAIDAGQVQAQLLLSREVYDKSKAYQRSAQMMLTPRETLFAYRGAHAVHLGAATANLAAQVNKAIAQATAPRASFDAPSVAHSLYDFNTGLWGDETS